MTISPAPDAGGTDSSFQGADAGTGGVSGVTLFASTTSDGHLVPVWHNQSQTSIFLYGCGTADLWQQNGSDWVKLAPVAVCKWEGVAPEVQPGSTYTDALFLSSAAPAWGAGQTYRLSGKYGVGCTNPAAGQSNAGCTALYEATSFPVSISTASASDDGGSSTGG